MDQKKEYTTFSQQVIYVIAASLIGDLLVFVQLPILTRDLGLDGYGIWSLITITLSLLVPFATIGLPSAIIRFLASEKNIGKIREDFFSALSIVCVVGISISFILFLLSNLLATFIFKNIGYSSYIRLASVLIFLNAWFQLLSNFFRLQRKIGLYTIITLIYNICQVGLIVLLELLGYKLTGAIIALIIVGILFNLICMFIIIMQIGFQFPRFSNIKAYIKWGWLLTPIDAIFWIIDVSDRYIVSHFMGVAAAGMYNAAYSIGNYASFALMPLGIVLFPNIAKTYDEKNLISTTNYLRYSFKYLMLITIPSAFGLSILAKPLLKIVTTPAFVSASIIVPFVAVGATFCCIFQITVNVMNLADKNQLVTILLGIAAGLNFLLNIILVPQMGLLGAALSTLITYTVLGLLTLIVSRRYLKFDMDLFFIVKSIFSAIVMTLSIWLINPNSIITIIISIFGGIIIYFVIIYLTKALTKEELAFLANLVKNKFKKSLQ